MYVIEDRGSHITRTLIRRILISKNICVRAKSQLPRIPRNYPLAPYLSPENAKLVEWDVYDRAGDTHVERKETELFRDQLQAYSSVNVI